MEMRSSSRAVKVTTDVRGVVALISNPDSRFDAERKVQSPIDRASSDRSTDSSIERKDWLGFIEDGLQKHAESKRAGPKPENVMCQVRRQLKELKPTDYVGEEFFFGLFNRSPRDANKSLGHKCKIAMFRAALDVLDTKDNWFSLCEQVVPKSAKIQDLYDEPGRDALSMEEIQIVLSVDAVFLACFLGLIFYPSFAEKFPILAGALDVNFDWILKPLTKDLVKVENQIPLSLLRNVLDLLVQKSQNPFDRREITAKESLSEEIFSTICAETLAFFSDQLPGWSLSVIEKSIGHPKPNIREIPFEKCTNFLDCMYRMICLGIKQQPKSGLRMKHNSIGCACLRTKQGSKGSRGVMPVPLDYEEISLPSATTLHEAGFRFRGCRGKSLHVGFKAGFLSATLYLPTLKLSDETAIMWRNMVAYEDCQNCGQDFIHYVEFMNNLIGSENDVMVLKSGKFPVIIGDTLRTNQTVATIFRNAMLQTSLRGPKTEKWVLLQSQIYEFHNRKERQLYLRLRYIFLSIVKHWLITLLLIIAFTSLYIVGLIRIH